MTSSSERRGFLNVPAPQGSRAGATYARFIPREELGEVKAWSPSSFGGEAPALPRAEPAAAETTPEQWQAQIAAARQAGYQDGYRDGLVALEGFKQGFAAQTTAQVGRLVAAFDEQLTAMEEAMAASLARSAVLMARQVLRAELSAAPQQVAEVARDAVNAVLMSARQMVVRVHPDDLALVRQGASEVLQARGGRLVADASITRGGVVIESDVGTVDASIESRWAQAAAALGSPAAWDAPADRSRNEKGSP
jgi:flagellar assembly protein FliH